MKNVEGFRKAVYADLYFLQVEAAKMFVACNSLTDKTDPELQKEIEKCNKGIQQSATELNRRIRNVAS